MARKTIQSLWLSLVLWMVLWVGVSSTPAQAQGSWPPFIFSVTPVYQAGQITYKLFFLSYLESGELVDLDIHIPLPEGTRYLKGEAQESTAVSFDGHEVRFFTSVLKAGALPNASFVVEIVDPNQKTFATQPWLAWKGQQPGDYLADPVKVDITKPAVAWAKWPFPKRMLLEASATVADDVITYYIFPLNYGGRMWDVTVRLPIPAGATFISAEPSGPFAAATFDGREVSFKALELPEREPLTRLQVKVSTKGVTSTALVTYAWAQWRNVGFGAGHLQSPKLDTRTGDIIVQPHASGWVMADGVDDVAFGYYDVSTLAVLDKGDLFETIFYTRDPLDPAGEPLLFVLYLNTTCQAERQYRLIFSHQVDRAVLQSWNAASASWGEGQRLEGSQAGPHMVVIQIPKTRLNQAESVCGVARVINTSRAYSKSLEIESVPDRTDIDVILNYSVNATMSFEERIFYYRAIAINLEKLETILATLAPQQQTSFNPDRVETAISYLSSFSLDQIAPFSGDALNLRDRAEERLAQLEDRVARLENLLKARALGQVEEQLEARFEARPEIRITRLEERVARLEAVITARVLAGVEERLDERLEDRVGRLEGRLAQLEEQLKMGLETQLAARSDSPETQPDTVPLPAMSDLSGNLALPLDNGRGFYDLYLLAMPTGQEIARIPDAHQPDFSYDGQRLLFDREGVGVNFIYEYNLPARTETIVSDIPNSNHPNYNPWATQVAYGNTGLVLGRAEWVRDENGDIDLTGKSITVADALDLLDELDKLPDLDLPQLPGEPIILPPNTPPQLVEKIRDQLRDELRDRVLDKEIPLSLPYQVSIHRPFLFVQCSLTPSQLEEAEVCQNVAEQGVLYPDQMAELQGSYPVWTANDLIVYSGCNTWAGSGQCGIFAVPAASTKRASEGTVPVLLTGHPSDLPADSKGGLITFTSRRDGDWEAYVMNLEGRQVLNLSQSPASNDGLPAISPDGQWVAFVSDRSGRWAVWVAPASGGQASHIFDLPAQIPWAEGNRAWYTERISWGPATASAPLTWQPAPTPDYQALYPTPVAPARAISLPQLPATVEAQDKPLPAPTATPTQTPMPVGPAPTPTPKL